LQLGVTDERFGLKVTLNAVDHNKITASIERHSTALPPHSQTQARVAASITEFGLDIDQDLLRAVTGLPRDQTLGKRLTGQDALHTTGPFINHGLTRRAPGREPRCFSSRTTTPDAPAPKVLLQVRQRPSRNGNPHLMGIVWWSDRKNEELTAGK